MSLARLRKQPGEAETNITDLDVVVALRTAAIRSGLPHHIGVSHSKDSLDEKARLDVLLDINRSIRVSVEEMKLLIVQDRQAQNPI